MARKKKTEDQPELSPVEAIMDTFDEYKEIRCVSLEKGGRVENTISTGSLIFDLILGGGFQRGRIAEIYGPEGSGKSTIMFGAIAAGQKIGIPCVFYDTEHSADPTYMKAIGINLEFIIKRGKKKIPGFLYAQAGPGEHVYTHIWKSLKKMPDIDPEKPGPPTVLFCIDSFAAMFSEAVDMESSGKGGLGRDARMHSEWLRQLKGLLKRKGALLFVTNQIRMKLNLANPKMNPEDRPGGHAMKHYADYVMRVSTSRRAKEDKTELMRQHMYVRTIKNKCFPPFQECEHEILLGRGLDKAEDAKLFLKAIDRVESPGGRWRIKLKRYSDRKSLSWKDFRALVEQDDFRDFAFGLLKQERVYGAYFNKSGYKNFSYDATPEAE